MDEAGATSSPPKRGWHQFPSMKNYVLTDKLGSGSYATVYKGFKKTKSDQIVAVKSIDRKILTKPSIDNLLTEIEVMKQLNHEHIVKLEDFEWDDRYIFLILEFCDGGDLSIFIRKKDVLQEKEARKFLRQLAMALQFLREKGIAHMDLKPQNLLLSGRGRSTVLKVADFGMAQHLYSGDLSQKFRGSPLYMAPEIMLCLPYDAKVDLWSVGVILYETLYGEAPFVSKTFEELESKLLDSAPVQIPVSPSLSNECKDLLEHLLQRMPENRLSFDEFFNHPFVDLEHMPGPHCLQKAKEKAEEAVANDSNGEINKALQCYTEAVEYFIPAMDWQNNQSIREELCCAISQYISRAEELKEALSKKQPRQYPGGEAIKISLKTKHPKVMEGYNKINLAVKAEAKSKFKAAFELYRDAVDLLLSINESLSKEESDFLRLEIQQYLTRMEDVQLLSQKSRFVMLRNFGTLPESNDSRCRLQ